MKKGKVLFVDSAHPVLKQELSNEGFVCDYFPDYGRDELKAIVGKYDGIIIRSKIKLDAEFLKYATQLRFIGRVGAGMENIDVEYARSKNIICLNAPEGNRNAVGEQALAMLLMLFNNLLKADAEVRNGIWLREENRGVELDGKTVGIVGYGNTGGAFARKLSGFKVKVLAYDKYKTGYSDAYVDEASMEELFARCDIISLHVPLTDETTYLVDQEWVSCFQKEVFLINTSRGRVVKTSDLIESLDTGKIKGACLDVLEYEGLSFENLESNDLPEDFHQLIQMENVVLSPHIAGWTHESNYKMAITIVEKIRKLNSK